LGNSGKTFAIIIISVMLLSTGIFVSGKAFAENQNNTTKLIHLGYLQLAAHDFFNVDRGGDECKDASCAVDNENGKLDLSTVLFNPQGGICDFEKSLEEIEGCALYDDITIANGGEKRSVENIMISTASAEVGEKYLQWAENHGGQQAYEKTVKFYHKQLEKAFEESFHMKFPSPQEGEVSPLHNLAMRTAHDFLPANIMFNGQLTSLFVIDPLGEKLSKKEKVEPSAPVDGMFEEEFRGIDFCPIPDIFCIVVDLLEADRSFGDQFDLGENKFNNFMAELSDGSFDDTDEVSRLLVEAFSRGLALQNPLSASDKNGSGGNEHLTRPTFGLSHETFETIVDNGFRINDQSFTIHDNHHTPFAQQTVNIGAVNSFEAKIYASKGLQVQEFLFGIPNVGEAHLAELGVEVWYGFNGEIEEIRAVQKSNVIDKETISVTHKKIKCQESDLEERCDVTKVSGVFLESLQDKVMAIKAIDYKNRYQITYLNEGIDIVGDSLNPMLTEMIPSTVRNEGLVKVTQTAKYSPYWVTEDGRMFERNIFGSFQQINYSFERFQDAGNPYTRLHSGFGGIIEYEQNRATQLFDSSEYISQPPDIFAHAFPESSERITLEMRATMLDQEEIAKKIIEESKVQARW